MLEHSVIGERQATISPMLAKHLFDTSTDIILVTDHRGEVVEISPSSMAVLGYRPDEMFGRNGLNFIHPDDLERTRDRMRLARRGQPTQNCDTRYVRKDGSVVTLAWSGAWSEDDQLHFFIGRDVTAAKHIERIKNEFVATMNHELRTPLTSLGGALGLLIANAEATTSPTLRLLTIAKANCQRLIRLVSGVLDLEKAESGKVVFVLKQIDVRAVVEQAIESGQAEAVGLGLRIGLNAMSDASEIRADPDWLLKAVNNLLSNAISFSPPGGEVMVGIEERGPNIRVSLRDHGPGIPNDFKDRVFEKFAQADNSDARTKGGVGLGLSIVKQIVMRIGGEVGFSNAPGGGAIFYFEFPVVESASDKQAIETQP
jgi:PAS domain S-box-containing protein